MKIVFLPGMDGTGLLFNPLIKNIPRELDSEIICLNKIQGVSYLQQAEQIAENIGSSHVVLVAESYSGRIAYELCNILGERVSKVIFVASFISCPGKLAKLAALLPVSLLKPNFCPNWLLEMLCFSGHGSRGQTDLVRSAISKVEPTILKQRLRNIAELEPPKYRQTTQAVYIRPTNDRLVDRSAVHVLSNIYTQLSIESVNGGHFIAQTEPESCAKVILRAITT